jgi:hypothetical protein
MFPNLEMLNAKGQAAVGAAVPCAYQAMASLSGLLYIAALMVEACIIIQRRDF